MFSEKKRLLAKLKKEFQKDGTDYIIITCSPFKKEKRRVKMFYEGELNLISYLLDTANQIVEEKVVKGKGS